MKEKQPKNPVSPEKLASNRKNAQRSTGPQTASGKQQSSQNAYKHGFYSDRLFPTEELVARDGPDYERIFDAYWSHYSPVGDLEKYNVEMIAAHSLRLARLLGYEQAVVRSRWPFEMRSMDRIPRYESNVSRRLDRTVEQLERMQAKRIAESSQYESSESEADEASDSTNEMADERYENHEEPVPDKPLDVGSSNNASDESVSTAPPTVDSSATRESDPAEAGTEPVHKPAETVADNSTPESRVQDAGAESLTTAIARATDPALAEQHMVNLEPQGNLETDPIGGSDVFELAVDEEMAEGVRRGDDMDARDDLHWLS